MTLGNGHALRSVSVLCYLALPAAQFACHAAGPTEALRAYQKSGVRHTDLVARAVHDWRLGYLEKWLAEWANRRAYEILAVAEGTLEYLEYMASRMDSPAMNDYQWKPGTDDLSMPAGRAKWALELLLGVKIPGRVDRNASPEYLENIREQARAVVEAYRQGIMALAADHEVPPDQFERLKRKYKHNIVSASATSAGMEGMHDLLGDWSPVGRRYEDLVSIIGAKGENRDSGVVYAFELSNGNEYTFCLTVRDGIIRSVRVRVRE